MPVQTSVLPHNLNVVKKPFGTISQLHVNEKRLLCGHLVRIMSILLKFSINKRVSIKKAS